MSPTAKDITMKSVSNNAPFATLDLDEDTANFLMKNCITNIRFGLAAIDGITSRDLAEKLVEQMNYFKHLRDMLRLANPSIKDDY
jgi:hypothetical protein